MIGLAIILQICVGVCLVVHFGKKEIAKQESISPGQTYEVLYAGTNGGSSDMYHDTIVAVKEGHVKYRRQAFRLDPLSLHEDVKTVERYLKYARPINLKANDPFSEEPKP